MTYAMRGDFGELEFVQISLETAACRRVRSDRRTHGVTGHPLKSKKSAARLGAGVPRARDELRSSTI